MKSSNNFSKTLWIGDIENWMDEKFIYQTFSEYAPVKGVKVMRDRNTGMALGYGFVEFENTDTAKIVLSNCNGKTIPNTNKIFKLNWASFGSGKNMNSKIIENLNTTLSNITVENMNSPEYSIYVGDLDPAVTESLLKEFFLKFYDSVISTKIVLDPVTKASKGYGFVKFKDYEQSQRALNEMNGKLLINKTMKTNQAAWKKNTSQDTNIFSKSMSNQNSFVQSSPNTYSFSNTVYNNSVQYAPQNYFNSYNHKDSFASQIYQNQYHHNYLNNLYQTYNNQTYNYNSSKNVNFNVSESCNIDNSLRNYENNLIIGQNNIVSQQLTQQYSSPISNQMQNINTTTPSNRI